MSENSKINNVTLFINGLTYWQAINLYITLLQAKEEINISFDEAKRQAILNYLLEEAINSPNPKV